MKRTLLITEGAVETHPAGTPGFSWTEALAGEFSISHRQEFPLSMVWSAPLHTSAQTSALLPPSPMSGDESPDAIIIQSPGALAASGAALSARLSPRALEFCHQLRTSRRFLHIPIIWVASQSRSADRIEAFAAGVDDCVLLPIETAEFVARLNARLRMKEIRESQMQLRTCGNLKYDPVADRAWVGEREVAFTLKQKELISYFMDHARSVVTRKELLGAVWPHASVSARTIDAHLTLLRRKLQDFDHEILSVHSIGYRLEPLTSPTPAPASENASARSIAPSATV